MKMAGVEEVEDTTEVEDMTEVEVMTEAEVMNNDVRKERNESLQRWLQHSQPQGKPEKGRKKTEKVG